MAGVLTPTQPRTIPGSRSTAPNAATLSIPQNILPHQPHARSPYTALSPVTQNGSYEFDRIIKAGEVLKRTRKTKASTPSTFSHLQSVSDMLETVMETSLHRNTAKHPIDIQR